MLPHLKLVQCTLLRAAITSSGLAILVLSQAALCNQSNAQETTPTTWEDRISDPIYGSWIRSESIGECVECHLSPSVGSLLRGKDTFGSFSRRREMEHWLQQDKHTIARRRVEPFSRDQAEAQLEKLFAKIQSVREAAVDALRDANTPFNAEKAQLKEVPREWIGQSNILSRRICDKLWGDGAVETDDGYAKFRDNCLTCHGGYQSGSKGFNLADVQTVSDDSQLGIDCNYCHQVGPNSAWVNAHREVDKWRLMAPEAKAAAGMRDLVNTAKQADMCFDCHVGNREKNMFVSHTMYAAGHPPIPSIELQEFCKEMPQHWQTPAQLHDSLKAYEGREAYFAINYPGVVSTDENAGLPSPGAVFWNTRKMLIGALAARAKSLELFIDSAQSHQWADYSLYDCASCHHELRTNSRRQQRYLTNQLDDDSDVHWMPGRPREHEWPDALVTVAYSFAAYASGDRKTRTGLLDSQRQLDQLLSLQPFGNAEQFAGSATIMRDQLDAAIKAVSSAPVTQLQSKQMLIGLSRTTTQHLLTYDSARQVIWAMQTIAAELASAGSPLDPATALMIESLGDSATTGVEAAIPSGRKQFIYRDALMADLKLRGEFDPAALAEKLDLIESRLAQ